MGCEQESMTQRAISKLRPHGPSHLSIIGCAFIWESVVWYTVLVHCPEFGGISIREQKM